MRIRSLIYRDHAKNELGSAVVELTGEEVVTLNNIIRKATKEQKGKSASLEMAKSSILLNALVQHGSLDSVDILALSDVDERLHAIKEV
nr:MAG TPA: hypothetical protein [Caudoviricetes sp.]